MLVQIPSKKWFMKMKFSSLEVYFPKSSDSMFIWILFSFFNLQILVF